MTTYKLNPEKSIFGDALIFVEQPHQGRARVWSAFTESEAQLMIEVAAERKDTEGFDLSTFDGAVEWLQDDLRGLAVIRQADIAAWLQDDRVMEAARYFDWVVAIEETEDCEA